MSRSNNTEIINPAIRFFEWSGDKGVFKYYDKETKENVDVALPFNFLVLDQLSTISGWDDAAGSGFWANEVRDLNTQVLRVRNKNGLVEENLYKNLNCVKDGAEYAKSIYIAFFVDKNTLAIGNLKLRGSGLSWIDFANKNRADILKKAITVATTEDGQKGKTKFKIPVFTLKDVSPETDAKATELDIILQEYLTAYFAKSGAEVATPHNRSEEPAPASASVENPVAASAGEVAEDDDDSQGLPF